MAKILASTAILAAGCEASSAPTLSTAALATEDAATGPQDAASVEADASPSRRAETAASEPLDAATDAQTDAPACDCDDSNPCTVDVCQEDGTCDTDLPPAGTACPGGECIAGECVAPDAAVVADVADAGAGPDVPQVDASPEVDTAQAPDAAPDALPEVAPAPDAGPEVALADAQAPEVEQPAPDTVADASGGDSDAGASSPDSSADSFSAIDVSKTPDAPAPACCAGDLLAFTGDCTEDGTQILGNVATVPGKTGKGYHFADGESGPRAVAFKAPGVQLAGDFTIQAWVRLAAHVDRAGILSTPSHGLGPQTLAIYATYGPAKGLGVFACSSTGVCASVVTGEPLQLGAWSHVAVVRKAGVLRLLVQGKPVVDAAFAGDLADALGGLWIGTGGWADGQHDLPGDLDGLRVSAGALYWEAFLPADTCK